MSGVYLAPFNRNRALFSVRDWALDSGAFSVKNAGRIVTVDGYIETCRRLRDDPQPPIELYALDVIGDWRTSLKNTETMWRAGIEAIPCFHLGEPWDVLRGYARDYPKIALGGHARARGVSRKLAWMSECFSRAWPKKIHGFGAGSPIYVEKLPFHSTDASSWATRPGRFGNWVQWGYLGPMKIRDYRGEVLAYLRAEREARMRWRKEMRRLEALDAGS